MKLNANELRPELFVTHVLILLLLILFQEKACDYPAIENGKLSGSLEHFKNYYFPMRFGQHADYYCHDGYSTPSGEPWDQTICSERGWSPEPKCLSKYISAMCSILLQLSKVCAARVVAMEHKNCCLLK